MRREQAALVQLIVFHLREGRIPTGRIETSGPSTRTEEFGLWDSTGRLPR
jgi:hypothetical protein